MKSNENTSIELRSSQGFIDSVSSQTVLNLFFQTEEKDGLLLYVGPNAPDAVFRSKRASSSAVVSSIPLKSIFFSVFFFFRITNLLCLYLGCSYSLIVGIPGT